AFILIINIISCESCRKIGDTAKNNGIPILKIDNNNLQANNKQTDIWVIGDSSNTTELSNFKLKVKKIEIQASPGAEVKIGYLNDKGELSKSTIKQGEEKQLNYLFRSSETNTNTNLEVGG